MHEKWGHRQTTLIDHIHDGSLDPLNPCVGLAEGTDIPWLSLYHEHGTGCQIAV